MKVTIDIPKAQEAELLKALKWDSGFQEEIEDPDFVAPTAKELEAAEKKGDKLATSPSLVKNPTTNEEVIQERVAKHFEGVTARYRRNEARLKEQANL